MIAIQHHLVIRDIGHRKNQGVVIVIAAVRHALELHPDFERFRQSIARLHLHQSRVVFTKCIFRFNLDRGGETSFLAIQRLFDFWQGIFITAVQIHHRLTALFDQIVLSIRQFVFHGHYRILGNLHGTSFQILSTELYLRVMRSTRPVSANARGNDAADQPLHTRL